MRKKFFSLLLISIFIFMLMNPHETFHGASEGLLLWFQIIFPTLFPFIIISNLLILTNSMCYITKIMGPVISPFFQTSTNGTFAFLVGFLCGYPMGAKVTADLLSQNKISKNEAAYLLSFCNNTSPAFIMNYVILTQLKDKKLLLPSLIILIVSPILTSFLFRKKYLKKKETPKFTTSFHDSLHFHFQMLDSVFMNGFEAITKVGGYIILFSVFIFLCKELPINNSVWNYFILPSLEITNGISLLASSNLSKNIQYILIMALVSFGGICSIAQTKCMICHTELSILPYIIEKLITTIVTSLLAMLYIYFY